MRKNILFIDDDKDFLEYFLENVKSSISDASVDFATSAKEAIVKLDRQDFNVVVSDYRMPGIDGIKLFEILDSKFPKIARIILTGYSDKELIADLKKRNILYLQKPCRIEDLVNTIDLAVKNV